MDKSKVVLVHVVKAYRGSRLGAELHSFLTAAVGGNKRSTSPDRFNPQGNNPDIGCRMGPRVSLDGFVDEKISYPWRDLNPAQSIPESDRCTDCAVLAVGCEWVSEVTGSTTRARFSAVTSELGHNGPAPRQVPEASSPVGRRRPEPEAS